MKSLIAFTKKEVVAQLRSAKFIILLSIFVLFGVMNSVVAKVTPLLLDMFSDALAETGMNISVSESRVLDAWVQFFGNISMALLTFILMQSNIFTNEYRSGTLILSLSKGLERFKVIISKSIVVVALWTVGYWLCFVTTYLVNMCFWDDLTVPNLGFACVCYWLFGIFAISLMVLFSTIKKSYIGVLGYTGGVVLGFEFISIIPKIYRFFPSFLQDGTSLIYGLVEPKKYIPSLIITLIATAVCFLISVPIFNKKQL